MYKRIFIFFAILVVALSATAQVSAQNIYREYFDGETDHSFTFGSASDQVTIGVTVMDNLSLKIVAGAPVMLTNFKWGATLQINDRDPNIIQYFASVNF